MSVHTYILSNPTKSFSCSFCWLTQNRDHPNLSQFCQVPSEHWGTGHFPHVLINKTLYGDKRIYTLLLKRKLKCTKFCVPLRKTTACISHNIISFDLLNTCRLERWMRRVWPEKFASHNISSWINDNKWDLTITFLCIMPRYVHPSSQHRAFPGSLLDHTEDHWIHLDSYHCISKSIL